VNFGCTVDQICDGLQGWSQIANVRDSETAVLVGIKSSGMLYFVWMGECLPTFQRSFETSVTTQPTTHRHVPEHSNHAVFSWHEWSIPSTFCVTGSYTARGVGGAEPDVAQNWQIVWHTAAVTELGHFSKEQSFLMMIWQDRNMSECFKVF